MTRTLALALVLAAAPAFAANRDARLQTDEQRYLTCEFGVELNSVLSVRAYVVTETAADGSCDAVIGCLSPNGLFGVSPTLVNGDATNSKVQIEIDPDGDAVSRNKNRYHLHILADDASGQRFACDGILVIENVDPGSL